MINRKKKEHIKKSGLILQKFSPIRKIWNVSVCISEFLKGKIGWGKEFLSNKTVSDTKTLCCVSVSSLSSKVNLKPKQSFLCCFLFLVF